MIQWFTTLAVCLAEPGRIFPNLMPFAFCWVFGMWNDLQASAEAVEIDKVLLIILGLFTELNSCKHLVSFPYNLSIKPAAGFWARREFWIRLVGIVFIPSLCATFIEKIPCCCRDNGNAFLSCLPVAPWNWGVWSFTVDLKIVTGIWEGFDGLRDGGTGWNRCFGDLSALRICYKVVSDWR